MDLSALLNKAKEWAGKNPDKADKGIDQGSSLLKKRFAGHEGHIESAATKAKEFLHRSAPPAQRGPSEEAERPPTQEPGPSSTPSPAPAAPTTPERAADEPAASGPTEPATPEPAPAERAAVEETPPEQRPVEGEQPPR
jgi:antitoxin protein of toxin-antitoxin system